VILSRGSFIDPETFSPEMPFYAVLVDKDVNYVTVKPIANDSGSSITVNRVAVASGTESDQIVLYDEVETPIVIIVTAEDGTTMTYTINIRREE
jgi:hypothetical protein